MPEHTAFGRRQPPAPARAIARAQSIELSPAAEAFRAQIAMGDGDDAADFGRWRRGRQGRLVLVWLLRLSLLAPGALSLALHLSLPLGIGLELAGIAANGWLQRERRRHRSDILAWSEKPATAPP